MAIWINCIIFSLWSLNDWNNAAAFHFGLNNNNTIGEKENDKHNIAKAITGDQGNWLDTSMKNVEKAQRPFPNVLTF